MYSRLHILSESLLDKVQVEAWLWCDLIVYSLSSALAVWNSKPIITT